jgi:hypothetical protein
MKEVVISFKNNSHYWLTLLSNKNNMNTGYPPCSLTSKYYKIKSNGWNNHKEVYIYNMHYHAGEI